MVVVGRGESHVLCLDVEFSIVVCDMIHAALPHYLPDHVHRRIDASTHINRLMSQTENADL